MSRNRLAIPFLGEWYNDLLALDSYINAKTRGIQAQSLLCAKLQERESKIMESIDYLAEKRGIDRKEMIKLILSGEAEPITSFERLDDDK